MIRLKGKYAEGIVYSDRREETGIAQIRDLLDQPFAKNGHPRFMPDYHAGLGSVIGTTLRVTDAVCPNLVGVDIGCGIRTEIFRTDRAPDFPGLDAHIRKEIPSGFRVHEKERRMDTLEKLRMRKKLKDPSRLKKSLGTLGGGNHYIEIGGMEEKGQFALTVHSGSRNLGVQVAEYYQKQAVKQWKGRSDKPPRGLETLSASEEMFFDYLHDMKIAADYAAKNRLLMTRVLFDFLEGDRLQGFDTVHNYIEIKAEGSHILRKGAVASYAGDILTIPLNMRDGILICEGLGNPAWNWSAPHGAGRLMSRSQARADIPLRAYQEAMKGIYTTSVHRNTLDEAPHAYKPMEEIVRLIGETAKILHHGKPVYNFKAG